MTAVLRPRPALRKFILTVHLTAAVGWIGAVLVYLALSVAARTSEDAQLLRSAFIAMELTGRFVLVPLAVSALLTGLVMSLVTPWGLFRHYWTVISLGLTALCTVGLILNMRTVSARADLARAADDAAIGRIQADLTRPAIGLLLLLVIMVLNVYRPRCLTWYGWHMQRRQRAAQAAQRTRSSGTVPQQEGRGAPTSVRPLPPRR